MIQMVIAHMVGDWVLQPRYMAIEKGKNTLSGYLYCLLHVAVYTWCYIIFVPNQSIQFYLSIAIPHFIIDKWSLMSHWQKFKDGQFWWQAYEEYPTNFEARVQMGFAGMRYAVEDNTAHLVCMYLSHMYYYVA